MREPIYYYVDHTCRFAYNSGIQRCVRSLARALLKLGQPLIPAVWDRRRNQLAPAGANALAHLARWNGPNVECWSAWPPPDAENRPNWLLIVELVSGPHNPSPEQLRSATEPLGVQLAWVFHDAIPVRWASLYGNAADHAVHCHARYMEALAGYERVFCNSHTTREHLLSFLRAQRISTNPDRILALPLGEEFGSTRPAAPAVRKEMEPLQMLCVSTLEQRKNHLNLFKALGWLHSQRQRNWQLQLVGWGADGRVMQQLERAQARGLPILWHARADDTALEGFYQQSDFTVYPSLEEGFGLPVAESLWQRRPCLCSGAGALGERAAAGGCLTVNTANWRDIAAGLERLLMGPELRLHLQQEADQRTFRSWSTVAQELLQSLEQRK